MTKTQKKYWSNIISYIVTSQDVIDDIANCDNDAAGAAKEADARLKFLTDNYILQKKPVKLSDISFFPQRKIGR